MNPVIEFQLFGKIKKEGRWWIAHCPPLDISTQGRTLSEAKKNLIEATELFVISCLERGTLDLALRELGWRRLDHDSHRIPKNMFRFPIHIPFTLQKQDECHA